MPEPLPELLRAVFPALLAIRDRHPEAFLAAFGDRKRIGRVVALVGELAVEGAHVDAEAHVSSTGARTAVTRRARTSPDPSPRASAGSVRRDRRDPGER